ncbi:hypothetical protein Tco_1123374 [Tanacetum coccineum]|uniref:Uncharacterized protein n=1 Tax=Tanacetum coccineum TaxID=301880 RepID=A0ABQ5J6Y2_9ASTR
MFPCTTVTHVCSPKLCNLTITDIPAYAKVLNVVAPKLENLTASISTCGGWCSVDFLQLSTKGFSSLEKVNLSKSNENDREDRNFPRLLDLFKKLSSAKFLTLDMDIIQTLSSNLDRLSREPGPFQNLKSVKINTSRLQHTDPIPTIPPQVRDYFLENSPNATFIIASPQGPRKRPRQLAHENTMSKKVAKLEERC